MGRPAPNPRENYMNAIVATKTDDILARQFALRFAIDTPSELIHEVTTRWNALLGRRFPGKIYFPEQTEVEVVGKKLVKVIHLHADSVGWSAYMKRGVSLRPMVDAALAAEGTVTPIRVPFLGHPARTTP